MQRTKTAFQTILFLIISLLIAQSCRDSQEGLDCFPKVTIQVNLNLNHPNFQGLQIPGAWVYVNEQQSGTRGLIVVNTQQGFKIYDRNAPHICPGETTTLLVEANSKLVCPHDGSEWNLLTGEPLVGSSVTPKMYRYQYNSQNETLLIFN